MPYEINALSSKGLYIRFKPTGLHPSGISGSGFFTIDGQQTGFSLTGNSDSNFIVTGHDNIPENGPFDFGSPSGITQIILTDGNNNRPTDYLVWKH